MNCVPDSQTGRRYWTCKLDQITANAKGNGINWKEKKIDQQTANGF